MDDIKVYDQYGNQLERWDETIGWLKPSTQTVHHEAVKAVEEKWHWETVREYPTGGKDVRRVIDVPGVKAQDAWVEEIPIYIYIPYTQEELDAIEAEKKKPTDEKRIAALEEELLAAKILLGLEV